MLVSEGGLFRVVRWSIIFSPHIIFCINHLLVVGVSACWCTCGSRCPGLGALVCAGSLPVAACRGLPPWALSGLCLGGGVSRISGSMAGSARAWTAASGACGLIAAAPWGFCSVAAGWFPWDSPLLFSGGVAVVPPVVLLGFLYFGGPLDVCGSDLLSVRPGTMGQVCGSSHSLLHIFVEKPCIQKRVHTHTHRC
ncbi:hypothetical protein GOODEAATRI_003670 [Goodea atripinnis]|uniref:Uncharacterized protein n=1 Tax=Goodea atripinnis TaxID=208336 RepID=A0ABV0PV05_9TELE